MDSVRFYNGGYKKIEGRSSKILIALLTLALSVGVD
jgi:hypothetical protein